MIPVEQTQFVADKDADPSVMGNCMQAAFGSLLELPLEDVPNFAAVPGENGEWWHALVAWLRSRGWAIVVTAEPPDGVIGLMSGKSPRGDWSHLVVACGPDLLHDPHPSQAGVEDPDSWWYLVPLDPKGSAR